MQQGPKYDEVSRTKRGLELLLIQAEPIDGEADGATKRDAIALKTEAYNEFVNDIFSDHFTKFIPNMCRSWDTKLRQRGYSQNDVEQELWVILLGRCRNIATFWNLGWLIKTLVKRIIYDITMRKKWDPAELNDVDQESPHLANQTYLVVESNLRLERAIDLVCEFWRAVSRLSEVDRGHIMQILTECHEEPPKPEQSTLSGQARAARKRARTHLRAQLSESFDREAWAYSLVDIWDAIHVASTENSDPSEDL